LQKKASHQFPITAEIIRPACTKETKTLFSYAETTGGILPKFVKKIRLLLLTKINPEEKTAKQSLAR